MMLKIMTATLQRRYPIFFFSKEDFRCPCQTIVTEISHAWRRRTLATAGEAGLGRSKGSVFLEEKRKRIKKE